MLLQTPHVLALQSGKAAHLKPYSDTVTFMDDQGNLLVLTDHDLYCLDHAFDTSGPYTLDDLRGFLAYVEAEVSIPDFNA
jgi:hypothetical protein